MPIFGDSGSGISASKSPRDVIPDASESSLFNKDELEEPRVFKTDTERRAVMDFLRAHALIRILFLQHGDSRGLGPGKVYSHRQNRDAHGKRDGVQKVRGEGQGIWGGDRGRPHG